MKQKIIIKNFGPIEDVEMEIDDFTIFIGPQTSGKSTIAKSVFFFLSLRDDMIIYLRKTFDENKIGDNLEGFKNVIIYKFSEYWGNGINIKKDSQLRYYYSERDWIDIEISSMKVSFSPILTQRLLHSLDILEIQSLKYHADYKAFTTSKSLAEKDFARNLILSVSDGIIENTFGVNGDLLFIPAGRSILSTLSEQIQNLNPRSLDPLMKNFIDRINASKGMKGSDDLHPYNLLGHLGFEDKTIDLLRKLSESIIIGSYFNDEVEGDKIRITNQNYIKLLFASSGQQEAVWIIQMILLLILNKQKVFIVIEEPEANLFPEAQKNIINLITLLANVNDNQVFITTHSPYLLTSLNNLVYAYQVGQKHPEKVSKIVDKQLWLNPEKLQAYFVGGKDNKGKIRSIIDPDLKIIQAEEIDGASRMINQEFDHLFNLE